MNSQFPFFPSSTDPLILEERNDITLFRGFSLLGFTNTTFAFSFLSLYPFKFSTCIQKVKEIQSREGSRRGETKREWGLLSDIDYSFPQEEKRYANRYFFLHFTGFSSVPLFSLSLSPSFSCPFSLTWSYDLFLWGTSWNVCRVIYVSKK